MVVTSALQANDTTFSSEVERFNYRTEGAKLLVQYSGVTETWPEHKTPWSL